MKYANIILNNQMAMEDLICKEDMRATSLIFGYSWSSNQRS